MVSFPARMRLLSQYSHLNTPSHISILTSQYYKNRKAIPLQGWPSV